jgi:SNF2 family DNA or RNA helicase
MNIESLRTESGFKFAGDFLRYGSGLMVIDESTVIKSIHAQQTKAAIGLGQLARYRRILTGTPIAHNPIDVFSQCKFLDKDSLPIRTMTAFKANFAVEELVSFHGRSFRRITEFRNLDKLAEMMAPFSLRLEKKDCLDLPPKIYATRYVEMTTEQRNLYKEVKDSALVQLSQGTLTTLNALGIMAKCAQITTGFVYNDERKIVVLNNNRVAAMLELIEDNDGKFIIWCPFKANVQIISDNLRVAYNDDAVVRYDGETDIKDRDTAVHRLQNDPACRFFVCTSAAAKGLTLTAACNVIYFGNRSRYEDRIQSEDRCHRIGQTLPVTYTDLVVADTVDERVLLLLKQKGDVATILNNNIKQLADLL